ncbi:MAG: PQQ-binding-like beta-propeller repeat protein, partial [Verrucomicrobiota bacterium]|nr:PQQ-binding-like beta-propeller repeat protein [Verrucomicrobiota bacterium]
KSAKIKTNLKKIIPTKDAEKITQIRTEISTIEESISKLKILNVNSEKTLLKSYQWQVNAPSPYDLILAGNIIFMGANDMVIGFDAESGKELWSVKVKGKTYGLAFSGGKLFASTTLGHIYCFGRPSS